MNPQPNTPASRNEAVAQCPTCKAPCTTKVNMRGGDYGWGTTDAERTVYRYAAPGAAIDAREQETPGSIREALRLEGFTLCLTPQGYRLMKLVECYAEATPSEALSPATVAQPVDMVLHCPKCGLQHVDAPESNDRYLALSDPPSAWSMPPWKNEAHRSHLCHGCGHIWRPADVPTNGVQAVKTAGKNDSPIAQPCASQGCGGAVAIADRVVRLVGEMDDRTSPEDWPEAMLVTGEELHAFILLAFETETEAALSTAPEQSAKGLTMGGEDAK